MDLMTGQLVGSYLAVVAQEALKRVSWFPWVERVGTTQANRVLAALLAAATTLGIQWTWTPEGALLITGLAAASIWQFALEAARSWIAQKVLFKITVPK